MAHEMKMKNPLASIKCLSAHMARGCSLDVRTVAARGRGRREATRLESIGAGFSRCFVARVEVHLNVGERTPASCEIARELKLLRDERAIGAGVTLELTGRPSSSGDFDSRKIHLALFVWAMKEVAGPSATGQTVHHRVGRPSPRARTSTDTGSSRFRGHGMSHDMLERFEAGPSSRPAPDGAGLGVRVAAPSSSSTESRLADDSAPGRGTTAIIGLPPRSPRHATR